MPSPYKIKEIFYTLQGEGAHTGRPAVFCRFSKCNLWSGKEENRAEAICTFCDTDFIGTDGVNGGLYEIPLDLAKKVYKLWPKQSSERPFVVCTGGEPLLQMDRPLIDAFHQQGFEVAVETNGTLPIPQGIDWVCVSPKGQSKIVVTDCNELKLVFPQDNAMPEQFDYIKADYFYLTPMSVPNSKKPGNLAQDPHTQQTIQYCLDHPKWRLNLQTHKLIDIA
ncbi:7-carboxy-7-deazaguanine synthase [Candidatus Methylomicrobium oryzae]|uniref:7-carboxy-7-deazaguanine synthase n=1 Tax=Candidatus Methylomicrobium oryzae TaxID=2802053 RepID=UPI001922B6D1|nr:7-carboxy-7-deazaguanine synthase [Methylomicrobium sp. RS1]MBL1265482.1 7-carboxy-7-deazaguanine synthase [Methylomicrobium sp. RS1]